MHNNWLKMSLWGIQRRIVV